MILEELLSNPKYRSLSVEELAHIILYELSAKDYDAIEGVASIGKSRNLIEKWNNENKNQEKI